MTVWHDIDPETRPRAKQGYKILFYYPAMGGKSSMVESVAFDYWPNRPPSKFTVVELPK